jgi:integrase/recombinase XerD
MPGTRGQHHLAEAYLDACLEAAKFEDPKAPLFQSVDRKRRLTGQARPRREVLAMLKRRAAAAGLPPSTCCHTFRATGITTYLTNGGTLEHAQQIAAHASPKTTKLYDRTADIISLDSAERAVNDAFAKGKLAGFKSTCRWTAGPSTP